MPAQYLIVGLGNFGEEYLHSRHNIGFDILDSLSARFKCSYSPARYGDKTNFRHKGNGYTLIKPSTFMNRSGLAVKYWLDKLKVPLEQLLVISDDKDLPLGKLRMKPGGNDGGHNGLGSIIETLATSSFPRLRFGIGGEFPKGAQVQHVLGAWTEEEKKLIENPIRLAGDAILSFGSVGIEKTMNQYN